MPITLTIVGRLFLALVFEIISAPIWWYSSGVVWILRQIGKSISDTANSAGLGLWVRNIFVPMYGQYDIWGRIVSFMIRVANIIARAFWVMIWVILCVGIFVLWIVGPAIVFYLFFISLLTLFM